MFGKKLHGVNKGREVVIRKTTSGLNCVSSQPTCFPIHGVGGTVGPEPGLPWWWLSVFVLLLQMGKGAAVVGAAEKISTLPPSFCSGKMLKPRVLLLSM